MSKEAASIATSLVVMGVFVAVYAAFMVLSASMEASAYNRVTGKHVTTWDAIWLDLRVQSEANE